LEDKHKTAKERKDEQLEILKLTEDIARLKREYAVRDNYAFNIPIEVLATIQMNSLDQVRKVLDILPNQLNISRL
jgi:hypothetical protein